MEVVSNAGSRWKRWLVRGVIAIAIGLGLTAAVAQWESNAPTLTHDVVLRVGIDDRHSPLMTGELVPIEQYASIMLGQTTTLAKQTFIDTANGQSVQWTLRLQDLRKNNDGFVTGTFSTQVFFERSKDRRDFEVLRVECVFGESGEHLLDLRVNDLATITGKLKLTAKKPGHWPDTFPLVIENAKVVATQSAIQ